MTKNLFKKGISGNPKGKPKGTFSEYKKRFIEIQKLAATDTTLAYNLLREALIAKEPWAFNIYFNRLYTVPKNIGEDTVKLNFSEAANASDYLKILLNSLSDFESYTKDDIIAIIKSISNARLIEVIENMKEEDNVFSKFSDEQIKQIVEWKREVEKLQN